MAIASGAALCVVELFHKFYLGLLIACYHHLCYALAWLNGEGLCREVYEQHAELATIVGIDGAGGVEHCYAVLEGKA